MSSVAVPSKVVFFGHFGSANPGNEGTLLAILDRLRRIRPEAEFQCVCSDPQAVAAREGIAAVPITRRTRRIWNRELPLPQRVPLVAAGLVAELREYARALHTLRGAEMLIVPGTGLITDAYGLARWGPYNLLKWTLVAKLRGARVLFVSIGAGPVDGRPGRALVRAALALADYRSYRDEASRDCLAALGVDVGADPVYPDLVFGLPGELLPADSRAGIDASTGTAARTAPVVGLGLMVYAERYSTRHPRPETHAAYLEALADLAAWLLGRGYRIRLLLGDSDTIVIDQFRAVLAARTGDPQPGTVIEQPIGSVGDILSAIAACDAVIATRFHNVLMAMLLNKPVIAISFHHKCSSLMRQMRLSEYVQDIHALDADGLIEQFQALERNRDALRSTLGSGVDEARVRLDEQYRRLFTAA